MKRVLAVFLAMMLCCIVCVGCVAEEEEELSDEEWEKQRAEALVKWEAACFRILEECGLKKDDAIVDEYGGNRAAHEIKRLVGRENIILTYTALRDGKEISVDVIWTFDMDQCNQVWYQVCRHHLQLAQEACIGINEVDASLEERDVWLCNYINNSPNITAIIAFRSASEYELNHTELKTIGNWSDFKEKYNEVIKREYKQASGRIGTKLEIQDKAVKFTAGDKYDTMELEIKNKSKKVGPFHLTVWLKHGTEEICRVLWQSPHHPNNNTIPDNERRSAVDAILEALKGKTFRQDAYKHFKLLKKVDYILYEEKELDGLLIRFSTDDLNQDYRDTQKKNKVRIDPPAYFLVQGT